LPAGAAGQESSATPPSPTIAMATTDLQQQHPTVAAPAPETPDTPEASEIPATPDTPEIAVRCRGLVKRYADVVAVDGLDLEVWRGECFGLLGPNGAGKTTTLEILEGLTAPDAGEVEVLGATWKRGGSAGPADNALRQRLGLALQETQFTPKLTVIETLRLFRSFYLSGRDPEDVLAYLALQEKRDAPVGKLSGGQKQRLAVACALVGNPELLFLDEPTTGLDPQSRLQLWELVSGFQAQGGTVALTTHYMDEAERLCNRVAIVDHGRVIALGTPAELIASLHAADVVEMAAEPDLELADLQALDGVSEVRRHGEHWILAVTALTSGVPALLALVERRGARLIHLSTHRATLEDVFVALTGRALREE
jgi:ABC-2 type transport system ATP-binding protein